MNELPHLNKLKHLNKALHQRERERMSIEGFREAAVLVPLLATKQGFEILFTVRSSQLRAHAGQIAFPGGRLDEGEDIVGAAHRETFEEVGLKVTKEEVLGFLDDHPSPARYIVTPVVAVIDWPKPLRLNKEEVEEVFTIPLDSLLNLEPRFELRQMKHYQRRLHFYDYENYVIWGLTGNVLKNLLDVWRGLE